MFLINFFGSSIIDAKTVQVFFTSTFSKMEAHEHDHTDLLGLNFQAKCFIYKYIFCQQKKCTKLFRDDDKFLQ